MLKQGMLIVSFSAMMFLGITGCQNAGLNSISVMPASQALSTSGETVQFTALGTYRKGNNVPTHEDVTDQAQWKSSDPAVATVSATGLATAVGAGTTTISASMNGFAGLDVGTSTLTVSLPIQGNLTSLSIIPGSQTTLSTDETGQYIAIGTFSSGGDAPIMKDLTSQVIWSSSDVVVATINSDGLVTASNPGTTTITAVATSQSGAVTTATATLTAEAPGVDQQLPTLTVHKVGKGAATGTVTAPATTPLVINCGSGTTGCTGYFTLKSTVTLTEIPGDSTFGGWSANCLVISPTQCEVTMSNNETVGAIFN